MALQVTFTNPFLKRVMFDTRINVNVGKALANLAECKNNKVSMDMLSDETKQFIAASPYAEKLNKLRATGVASTKYNLDPIDYATVDYRVLKRYISSARLRVPLKVQSTISMVINNLVTDFLTSVRAVSKTMKLANMDALRAADVEQTTLGRIFETVGLYRSQSDYAVANPDVHEHIASTLQRAYKHSVDAHTVRGARLDDALLKNITESLCVVINRLADALTHVNNATANKTVKNEIVRTLFEVYGLLTGYSFVGCFKPQIKLVKSADAAVPAPIVEAESVAESDADADAEADVAEPAPASVPAPAPASAPADAKRRRSKAKKVTE